MNENPKFLFTVDRVNAANEVLGKIATLDFEVITLDVDQIMLDTETPVIHAFFLETNLDYRLRKIDQWLALANWAKAEGHDFDKLAAIENRLWTDPEVLSRAQPNPAIQRLSKLAVEAGKDVHVITARRPHLAQATMTSLTMHYPWINPNNVHLRKDTTVSGADFKAATVVALGSDMHIEDSVVDTQAILTMPGGSEVSIIQIPRELEFGAFTRSDNVVELPEVAVLAELMDY